MTNQTSSAPPPPMLPTRSPVFRVMNALMTLMLRSPLHGAMSRQLALITVTGRRTGKRYTTPIGYLRVGADHVHVFTHAPTWWKNLRGGATVTLRLAGKDYSGTGVAIDDPAAIVEPLYHYLEHVPGAARAFGTRVVDGSPLREDVVAHAPLTVMVDITLDPVP